MATTDRADATKASTFPSFNLFSQAFQVPSFDNLADFKLPGFDKLETFKVPGLDIGTVLDIQRRNIEAMTAAAQTFTQGMQTIVQRQGEIARQSLEQFRGLLTVSPASAPVEDKLVKQVDLAKASFEKNVADSRELFDLVAKVTDEATDILSRRVVASLDEVKAAIRPKAAERTVLTA
jgi:phasin family protein